MRKSIKFWGVYKDRVRLKIGFGSNQCWSSTPHFRKFLLFKHKWNAKSVLGTGLRRRYHNLIVSLDWEQKIQIGEKPCLIMWTVSIESIELGRMKPACRTDIYPEYRAWDHKFPTKCYRFPRFCVVKNTKLGTMRSPNRTR